MLIDSCILGLNVVYGIHSIDLIDERLVLLLLGGIVHQCVYIIFTPAPVDLLALGFRFVNNVQDTLWKVFLRVCGLSKDGTQLILVLDSAISESLLQSEALELMLTGFSQDLALPLLFLDTIDEGKHLKGRKFVQIFLHCCHPLPDNISSHPLKLINDLILLLDLK